MKKFDRLVYNSVCKYCNRKGLVWGLSKGKWSLLNHTWFTPHYCKQNPNPWKRKKRRKSNFFCSSVNNVKHLVGKIVTLKNGIRGLVDWDGRDFGEAIWIYNLEKPNYALQKLEDTKDIIKIEENTEKQS